MDLSHLVEQLERARSLRFVGPVPASELIAQTSSFALALQDLDGGTVIDLGSGGGVPGLVLAVQRPDLHLVLMDATAKRCRFLESAVTALGVDAEVVEGRAEALGRTGWRGSAGAVVARSFGPPATTAECAAPLLAVGGLLVVSEPPGGPPRWPSGPLSELGLRPDRRVGAEPSVQVLLQTSRCPAEFPRRDGVPAKRPLF